MISVAEKESFLDLTPSKEREGEFRFVSDIDDLLADCIPDWIPHLNRQFNTLLTLEEAVSFGFVQNVPQWRQHGDRLFEFMRELRSKPEFVMGHKVTEGAVEGIVAIAKIAKIELYVTTRPESVHEATVEWLKTHGFPEAPVKCLPDHLLMTPEEKLWKRKMVEESGVDLVLEDNIEFAESLLIPTIIVEGRHNKQTPQGSHIIKVSHWRYVPEQVSILKEARLRKN